MMGGPRASATTEPLLVYAAADLQFALGDVAAAFAAEGHPRPTLTFGSTGLLSRQIENGAPADLLFAADEHFVAALGAQDLLLPGTSRTYAVGRLALVERAGLAPLTTLDDLRRPDIRTIAIANPEHAPYGQAAREALRTAGVWPDISAKIVLGENITQTFRFVQTGNADAGLVALSVVLGAPGTRYSLVDTSLHSPLVQAVAILRRTKQPQLATAFLDYTLGPRGRAILARYGFAPPADR